MTMLRLNVAGRALLPALVWLCVGCTVETVDEEPVDTLQEPVWGAQSNPPNGWLQWGQWGYACEGFDIVTAQWNPGKAVWNGSAWVCAYYRTSTDIGVTGNMWGLMASGSYLQVVNTGQPIPSNAVRSDSGIPLCLNLSTGLGGRIPGKVTGSGASARCKFASGIINPVGFPFGMPASTASFEYVID